MKSLAEPCIRRRLPERALKPAPALIFLLFGLLFAAASGDDKKTTAAAETAPPLSLVSNTLDVLPIAQEGALTCWSACAEMIMYYHTGDHIRQCQQADPPSPGHPSECCDGSYNLILGECDHTGLPNFPKWGFMAEFRNANPLTWEEVKDEINQDRPFAFTWINPSPSGASSHMMVVIGYDENGPERRLLCLNPLGWGSAQAMHVPYANYAGHASSGPGAGYIHQYDYVRIH